MDYAAHHNFLLSCSQVQNNQQSNQLGSPQIKGTIQGLNFIVRNQGWKQLFAGLSLNYVKVFIMLYDHIFYYGCPCCYSELSGYYLVIKLILTAFVVIFQVVPSVAIGFTAYDMMKSILRVPPREKTAPVQASA